MRTSTWNTFLLLILVVAVQCLDEKIAEIDDVGAVPEQPCDNKNEADGLCDVISFGDVSKEDVDVKKNEGLRFESKEQGCGADKHHEENKYRSGQSSDNGSCKEKSSDHECGQFSNTADGIEESENENEFHVDLDIEQIGDMIKIKTDDNDLKNSVVLDKDRLVDTEDNLDGKSGASEQSGEQETDSNVETLNEDDGFKEVDDDHFVDIPLEIKDQYTEADDQSKEIKSEEPPADSPTLYQDKGDDDVKSNHVPSDTYEFPALTRLTPGQIGDVVEVELEPGKVYKRITRAMQPPVFEIPNFLSDEECDLIIQSALDSGLSLSNVFGEDVRKELDDDNIPLANVSRVSQQTWLDQSNLDLVFHNQLEQRVAKLTELPVSIIKRAESIQVVSYIPGGHYHAHLDSQNDKYHLPCCFQKSCAEFVMTPQWGDCCRLCRYITVLYYLNDPEEGGETAFPLADKADTFVEKRLLKMEEQDWFNLSYYCYNSSLVVKPKRGTAVMWYNHFVDEQTGYLGTADLRSHHGGCDLKKGRKWIANTWISATTVKDKFIPSIYAGRD